MPDASPAKWHLAHTTWFFEHFVLGRDADYEPRHPEWHYLFNSYYQSVGPMHARPHRGMLTRPGLDEVLAYRRRVDEAVAERIVRGDDAMLPSLIELGVQHEQQHQELLLTDIKHAFAQNPLEPVYAAEVAHAVPVVAQPLRYVPFDEGVVKIGHEGTGFAFDNEGPRHRAYRQAGAIANRPVTNAEYMAFVRDGGYRDPLLWLSDGWAAVQAEHWFRALVLGRRPRNRIHLAWPPRDRPPCTRMPPELFRGRRIRALGRRPPAHGSGVETMAAELPVRGNLQDNGVFQPCAASFETTLGQMYGDI